MPTRPGKALETFPNPSPDRDYVIRHVCPEYTAICPVTGQPDFGTIVIVYTPDRLCVELKSLKLYLWSFRAEGHYFEQVTNQILDDLVRALRPRRMSVIGKFNVRGGITSTVVARHPAQERPTQDRPAQERPTQDRPAQERPTQERPAQVRPGASRRVGGGTRAARKRAG